MEFLDGAYGVTVNTEVCGTFDSGSIPDRHPKIIFSSGTIKESNYS